ncbi:MAG: methyltransferase domain-containing protein [Gemmatimonadaceae bacterium]
MTSVDAVELGNLAFDLMRPRSAEDLISEADFDRDERLPYWADLWPSGLILAARIAEERASGRRLLELGCGVGLVTLAAMHAGWRVVATDYYEDALRFTRANAWRALHREPAARLVDWRAFPSDLGTFDRVAAADVLYERPYAALVANALAVTVAPGGDALIADPGRVAAGAFVEACEALGFTVARDTRPFEAGAIRQQITIYALRR